MNPLREWFAGLAPRERVAVIVGAAVVLLALFYYALWQPLNHSLAAARTRVTAESDQARWMLGIRDEARRLQAGSHRRQLKGRDKPLLSIVDTTSRENSLGAAVTRIQPDNDNKTTVTLAHADFNQLLFWLRALESDYGVTVTRMTVSREDKAGTVGARLTLVRAGG